MGVAQNVTNVDAGIISANPDRVFVDLLFAGTTANDDPDGPGQARSLGFDAFASVANALTGIDAYADTTIAQLAANQDFGDVVHNRAGRTTQLDVSAAGTTFNSLNLTDGTLAINSGSLTVTGGATVNGGTLSGTATIDGNLTVNSGSLAPGNSPGTIIVNGNLVLANPATFDVEINGTTAGTEYDQVVVNGTVSLGNAVLNVTEGFDPTEGDEFILIANDGTDAVTGTFNNLAEGATVVMDFGTTTLDAVITYQGGDGNDVAIVVDGTTTLPAPTQDGANDVTLIRRQGTNLQYLVNGVVVTSRPLAGIDELVVTGTDDSDTLTIDLSGGNPIPTGGITFIGGANITGPGDELILIGGTTTTVTHSFTNANDGSVTLVGALAGTITYTGLEPITDNVSATDRVFEFTGAAETVTLSDAGAAAEVTASGLMLTDAGAGGAAATVSTTFANLTGINGVPFVNNDMIEISGIDADGVAVPVATFTITDINVTTLGDLLTQIDTEFDSGATNKVSVSVVAGIITVTSDNAIGISPDLFVNLTSAAGNTGNMNADPLGLFTVQQQGSDGINESLIDSTLGESVRFTNPTNSLTVTLKPGGAAAGDDTLNVQSLDALFDADLSITGAAGDSVVFQTADLNLATGGLTVNTGTIQLDGNITTDGGDVSLTGAVVISAADVIINTETDDNSNAGGVTLSGSASSDATNQDLTIRTSTGSTFSSGAVEIATFNAAATQQINTLTIDATNAGSGTAGSVMITNDVGLAGNLDINGGAVTFSANADVSVVSTFTADIDASGALAFGNGASVAVINGALTVTGAGVSFGASTNGDETLQSSGNGTITVVSTGASNDISLGDFAIDSGSAAVDLVSGQAIVDGAGNTTAKLQTTGAVSLTAATSAGSGVTDALAIDVTGTTALTIDVNEDFNIFSTDGSTLTDLTLTIDPSSGADTNLYRLASFANTLTLTLTDDPASGASNAEVDLSIAAGDLNFSLTTDTGNIEVGDIGAGTNGAVTLTATAGAITDRDTDASVDITASSLTLTAMHDFEIHIGSHSHGGHRYRKRQ